MIKQLFSKIKASNGYVNASYVYIIANGLGQGTTLLANIFFTRYMSQSDYGLYGNYYSYVSILVPFVGMNLYAGLSNSYIDYKEEIHKFRSSVLSLSLIGLAFTTMVMLILKMTVGLSLSYLCILIALAHAYGFFMINYYITSLNMENRFMAKGLMLAVPNILQALLAVAAILICNTFVSRAIGASAGVILCGAVATTLILIKARPKVNTLYWRYVLRISLPSIIGSVSEMIMQQCDKVMITSLIGANETAIYSLIFNIGYILYAVHQATNGVVQVWLFNTLKEKEYDRIPKVQKWYMFLMLILATGLYMLAPEIIKLLAPESYWHFEYVVPFIIGSYLMIMYSLTLCITHYEKKTGINSAIVLVAAVINVALNYILIPKYSGVGAAFTSVVSYFFIFAASSVYLMIKSEFYFDIKIMLTDGVVVCVLGFIYYILRDMIVYRYLIFTVILALEVIYAGANRKDIASLLEKNADGKE